MGFDDQLNNFDMPIMGFDDQLNNLDMPILSDVRV